VNEALATDTAPKLPRGARRRLRNREAILDAAEQVFASTAFAQARIEDIAEAADLSVGSLYMHFGNKEGLLIAVAERALENAAERLTAALNSQGTPTERINAAGRAYMNLLLDHPVLVRYIATDVIAAQLDAVEEHISETIEFLRSLMEGLIDEAIDAGEIRPIDSRVSTQFLFGAWNGVAALTLRSGPTKLTVDEVRTILEQAQHIIFLGMTRKPFDDDGGYLGPTANRPAQARPTPN